MLVVAGLSLKNLEPRVWDPASEYHIPSLSAIMVSYGEFHQLPGRRALAMEQGLRKHLGVPEAVKVYLDNGAFYFGNQDTEAPIAEYEEFVGRANPDWKPIPRDFIPFPSTSWQRQRGCFVRTMKVNQAYQHNGFVPVVHIGRFLGKYTEAIAADDNLSKKDAIALGGIVPNLLRKPSAISYSDLLDDLQHVREVFRDQTIHVFGVGGTATLHMIALLGFDSADSSGWRNRAARGIIQLPGSGERLVAYLGKWRGRQPSKEEWAALRNCRCPACRAYGVKGLKANKLRGFCCRATHNLWILLKENEWLSKHIGNGTYRQNYRRRLDNSVYKPIITELLRPCH